jgi:exoribonuclease-2
LRWLQQQQITSCTATVLKEDLIRLNNAPLVARLAGLPQLSRGQQIELHITGADELALELEARYVSLLDAVIEAADLTDERDANQVAATELEAAEAQPSEAASVAVLATPSPESSNTSSAAPPPLA